MSRNPYETKRIADYSPPRNEKFDAPGKYYNSLIKPTLHKASNSTSALKTVVYEKPVPCEVVNALYLYPKINDCKVKDELLNERRTLRMAQMKNQSKVIKETRNMYGLPVKQKEVKFN